MTKLALREFHSFDAAGARFLYLVPSAAIVRLDEPSDAVLRALEGGPRKREEIVAELGWRHGAEEVDTAIAELLEIRAIGAAAVPPERVLRVLPAQNFPLTTMVLNVTSKCNLACKYCYEYGEDRVVDDVAQKELPRFMDYDTARQSVDFMFDSAGTNDAVNLTFFGGETLLNFQVLQRTVVYALGRGAELGKEVRFSLTTNGTLLKPEIIEWLIENDVGVTISVDGPRELQDEHRVFHNGKGSYDVMMPRVKQLLQRRTGGLIGARVTLTRQNMDVIRIFRHLTEEIGFQEVGFAPVTTSWTRDFALGEEGYTSMLQQFEILSREFLEAAIEGRHHAFGNIKETIEEIHKGVSKAYPCGAGLGLVGVATDGDVALCHRFAGSDEHRVGSVYDGLDRARQAAFLERNHLANKTDCSQCWVRPICSGGCYHEAHTRYGTTEQPNLHYCDWIRAWTDICLRIYAELAERRPGYFDRFDA